MKPGQASETAYRAARARARHQLVDSPRVFDDPFAARLLRQPDRLALERAGSSRGGPLARGLRFALAVRSRIAEDALHQAVARGVRQYVILGAGLDTFAFRNPYPSETLRVFEVDHPDTQAGKRALARDAGLDLPHGHVFVPVDFATQSLASQLQQAGFRSDEPAFFTLLGVSMYLELPALLQTLGLVASCAKGTEIVFDYTVEPRRLALPDKLMLHLTAFRCARLGEPWKCFLDPQALPARLQELGFSESEDLGGEAVAARIRATLPAGAPARPPRFGMGRMMLARV